MSRHSADILWQRDGQDFVGNRYSRRHTIRFDGGAEWSGSSSPHVVPVPLSDASAVDPEELFVASLSSCHMLWFLSVAASRGFCVERYADSAEGRMGRTAAGKVGVTLVTLRPQAWFSGERLPSPAQIEEMHHSAHGQCFIANSVLADVRCEPVPAEGVAQ